MPHEVERVDRSNRNPSAVTVAFDMRDFAVSPVGRIGLFGGTFDPPHWGHIRTALGAADELSLDQVAFLPAVHPPHKEDKPYSPIGLRRRMLELCLPIDPRFRLCLVEEEEDLPGTTFETVQKLREIGFTEDRCHLIWLMGSDSLLELGEWHRPDDLLDNIEIAVMPRLGFSSEEAEARFLSRVGLLNTPLIEISAHDIRSKALRLGEVVPAAVAQFIIDSGLYGFSEQKDEKEG